MFADYKLDRQQVFPFVFHAVPYACLQWNFCFGHWVVIQYAVTASLLGGVDVVQL